jgi:hypothetical protein
MTKTFEVGNEVTVSNLKAGYPKWALYVKPENRRTGAGGRVVGFYRTSQYSLVAVAHNDGSAGVYEEEELS